MRESKQGMKDTIKEEEEQQQLKEETKEGIHKVDQQQSSIPFIKDVVAAVPVALDAANVIPL